MKILDTFSGKEKEIDISKKIQIYLCGMTVYDEAHIGHARTIIVFDVLRRFLESQGAKVKFIQNFTDVDDKIINRAKMENVTAFDISTRYIDEYFDEFDKLNVKRATGYPKATDHIQDMINLIQSLEKKGIAYPTKNGMYFAVTKFADYGKLSKNEEKLEELISGSRIQVDEEKDNPLDFSLWKFSNEEPCWESPWGKGRPGWHIECSAMSIKYLGENFEIHGGGGRDLIFPHHENEIAQSESFTQKPFAQIWMHVAMVTINGEKMSKSLGNIKSVKYLLEKWSPNIIRLFCIVARHSKPIDYSESLLKEHEANWSKVRLAYHELKQANGKGLLPDDIDNVERYYNDFVHWLDDDLNTHEAVRAFYRVISYCLALEDELTIEGAKKIMGYVKKMMDVLGLKIQEFEKNEEEKIMNLIKQRNMYREKNEFAEADKIRDQLNDIDIELVDFANRTIWMRKEKIKSE